MTYYKKREEIPCEYLWNNKLIYNDNSEWQKDYDVLKKLSADFIKYKGTLHQPKQLKNFLTDYFQATQVMNKLLVYCIVSVDEDLSKSEPQANYNQLNFLINQMNVNLSFFELELNSLDESVFIQPDLFEYQHYLKSILRLKNYRLSIKEEEIVLRLTKNMERIKQSSSNLLTSEISYGEIECDGETFLLNSGNYQKFAMSNEEEVRKNAFLSYYHGLEHVKNTVTSILLSYIEASEEEAMVHHYSSTLESVLKKDNIPEEVYSSLKSAVLKKSSSLKKYFKLMKKVLKVPVLHNYDLSAPWISFPEEVTVEESKKMAVESLSILGRDYTVLLKEFMSQQSVDYCTYKNKCSGAYNISSYGIPSRILMNHNGSFLDTSTLIHELGHAMHHKLSEKNNPIEDCDISNFIAEVSSLTNEFLLMYHVLDVGLPKEKLLALANGIKTIFTNLFSAVSESILEEFLHDFVRNGEKIDADILLEKNLELLKKLYPTVEINPLFGYFYLRRSHYYTPFYLFKYATSVSVAINVATKIKNADEKMKKNYLEFLSNGGRKDDMELLSILGYNMKEEKVYLEAIDSFEHLLDEFNTLFDKQKKE